MPPAVIPAKAEIQKALKGLDSCSRRNDDLPGFGRNSKVSPYPLAIARTVLEAGKRYI